MKCADVARKFIIGINILFLITAIIVIILGANASSIDREQGQTPMMKAINLDIVGDLILFTGVASLVVSLFGLAATKFQWKKLLIFYLVMFLVISISLMALGDFLRKKTAENLRVSWNLITLEGNNNRIALMNVFGCCGFDRVTDSYQLANCPPVLENNPYTPACKTAVQTYINAGVVPIGQGAIVLGVFKFLALIIALILIFTSKEMQAEFYENPFHG